MDGYTKKELAQAISRESAAKLLHCSVRHLENLAAANEGPTWRKHVTPGRGVPGHRGRGFYVLGDVLKYRAQLPSVGGK